MEGIMICSNFDGYYFLQLLFRYANIGIVSYGVGCARSEYPGVYARVSEFMQFIENNAPGTKKSNC